MYLMMTFSLPCHSFGRTVTRRGRMTPLPVLLQLGAARTSSLLTAQTRMIPPLLAGIIAWDQCSAGPGGIAPVCHHRPTQRPHSYAPHEARVMIVGGSRS